MGCIGGTVFNAFKGFKMDTTSMRSRGLGALTAVKTKAPVLGGNFAVWGLCFSACDCTLVAIRNKEDPWNSIASGAFVGGLLSVRQGRSAMITAAIIGGCLLAMIEGVGIVISRVSASQFKPVMPTLPDNV